MASLTPAAVVLSAADRAQLAAQAADAAHPALALRARIVLACAESKPNARVAADLGVSRDTVRKWRSRFAAGGLAALRDAPRPGAPRIITDDQVRQVLARTTGEPPPAGLARWTTRAMASATGLSQSAVSRIWRAAGLAHDGPGPGPAQAERLGINDS